MIFYTLKGPNYILEIYENQIKLTNTSWFAKFSKLPQEESWEIKNLAQFEIVLPKFMMFSGKIQWKTFDGQVGQFRFSTTMAMVKKIESYLQKRVIKNHQEKYRLKNRPEERAILQVA